MVPYFMYILYPWSLLSQLLSHLLSLIFRVINNNTIHNSHIWSFIMFRVIVLYYMGMKLQTVGMFDLNSLSSLLSWVSLVTNTPSWTYIFIRRYVNMEHQLDATITVLLIFKISSTCFRQAFAHLQERKTEMFYDIWHNVLLMWYAGFLSVLLGTTCAVWSWRSIKLLLLHLVGVPYLPTYIDDARSNTNQLYIYLC
jgi:hypothetical protein